jgi:tetratricopeptide (TPR) repeat protein
MDNSALDYTKYTDESVWEDSFEGDQKMDTLLSFNKSLLEGFTNFQNRNIPGLIKSYQNALDTLERGKSPNHLENLITIKSNLGIAYYFNNEIDKAIFFNNEALKLINQNGRTIDRQLENIQSLYLKIMCNLIVFKMVKKEDEECHDLARQLINFLNSM